MKEFVFCWHYVDRRFVFLHFADIKLEVLDCTAAKDAWQSSNKSGLSAETNKSGKRGRGRPPKIKTNCEKRSTEIKETKKGVSEGTPSDTTSILSSESGSAKITQIKRGPGRPRKIAKVEVNGVIHVAKRGRGRPKKIPTIDDDEDSDDYVLTATGNYSCLRCPKIFTTKCSYILHQKKKCSPKSKDSNPKLTVNCDSDLRHSTELQGHGQPTLSPKKLEINGISRGGPAVCPLCSKFFMKVNQMLHHLVRVHYFESLNLPTMQGSRHCSVCDTTISTFEKGSVSMQDHLFNEHVDWNTCPVCKTFFATKNFMLQHLHDDHGVPKAREILNKT